MVSSVVVPLTFYHLVYANGFDGILVMIVAHGGQRFGERLVTVSDADYGRVERVHGGPAAPILRGPISVSQRGAVECQSCLRPMR